MKHWLRCPHGEELRITNIGGLVFFEHKDGQCDLMNDYGTTVGQVLSGHEFEDGEYKELVFVHSESVRDGYFAQMSTLNGQALNDELRAFITKYKDDRHWAVMYDHAITCFGSVLVDNTDVIATDLMRVPPEDAQKARVIKPKYGMQNLKGTQWDKLGDRVASIRAGLLKFDREKAWLNTK